MHNNKPGSRLIKAAGAVAWRPGPDGEPDILLVHRTKYNDWSLPKGKTEPGEPLPVTAVREVLEEGGVRLALGRRLISVRYNVSGRPKRVHYWAARAVSMDEHAVPNSEVDEVAWVPAARAVERVSYVHDHGVLADFAARTAATVPLILLRHAKAMAKSSWKHSDAVRPLDDSGRFDAKTLADVLACFAPRPRLISSSAVRCADTLRPLAELTGEKVREERLLYVHDQSSRIVPADPGIDVAALIREVIASGEPTVICAHRENLPALQEAALAALAGHPGAEIPATEIPGGPSGSVAGGAIAELPSEWDNTLPTSGFWVLNVAPLPQAPEQTSQDLAETDPDAADQAAPGSPGSAASALAPARRWWQRVRAGAGAGAQPAGDALGADVASGNASASGAASGDSVPRGAIRPGEPGRTGMAYPAGVLVSADRYDLSES